MKTLPYFAVASQQVTTHRTKVEKLEATLNAGAASNLYLQVFDTNVAPAAGVVPLKSWPAGETGWKDFKNGELVLNAGLFVALSTTAATYTAVTGGSNILDILQIEIGDAEVPTGTSFAGDLTTPTASLQVWSAASGPKKLIAVEVDNTGNGVQYLMLFSKDTVSAGDKPIDQFTIKAAEVKTAAAKLDFGVNGRDMTSYSSNAQQNGCTLVLSSTTGVYTAGSNGKIRAEYK